MPRRSLTLEYFSERSARARPDWSRVSWAKRERLSSVERRAWERRRAATTSEEASATMASGSEESFSGPRRRGMWLRVGFVWMLPSLAVGFSEELWLESVLSVAGEC